MSEAVEVRYVGDVQRLELKSGDVLVCRVPYRIPEDTAKKVRAHLKERFTDNEVVVLGDGMELSVVERAVAKTDEGLPFRVPSSEMIEGGRWEVNHEAVDHLRELIKVGAETLAEIKKLRR